MAFTKALYYPMMDIEDKEWLKNAILYWDEIKTISPASVPQPYESAEAIELYHEGVISPLYVHSEMEEIRGLKEQVAQYIDSQEADGIVLSEDVGYEHIHVDKLPDFRIERGFRDAVLIHDQKWPNEIRERIAKSLNRSSGSWLAVDRAFAHFYMTLLATRLGETAGLGLLTDVSSNDRLATSARLDARVLGSRYRFPENERARYEPGYNRQSGAPQFLAQGLLADLTLQRIAIDPETPIKSILAFKRDHSDELGKFRVKMAELTSAIEKTMPLDALRQSTEDIYKNELKPALADLKNALSSSRIRCFTESFLKTSLLSVSTGSLLVNFGLSTPHAILAASGISITASMVLYNQERRNQLESNPLSYVLAAERHFLSNESPR